jgi:beta-lactamase superfamily II metal-dependent hydrolase
MLFLKRLIGIVLCWTCVLVARSAADSVVPLDDVTSSVVVHQSASSTSTRVGNLRPGEHAELVGSVPNWHHVKLTDGTSGFVSKRWTRVVPSTSPAPSPSQATYTIDVVDVGTGLAALVRGPDFTLVYDGGSNDDLARGIGNRFLAYIKAVAPTLTTIDQLILSHPHRDHVELLPDLFAAYAVRQVWDSGRLNDICGYRAFITAVHDEPGVQYHNALQDFGTRNYSFTATTCYGQAVPAQNVQLTLSSRITDLPVTLGQNATMTILHSDGADYPSPNQNSLVVRLNLGATRVLLMGDAEAGGRQSPSVQPTPDSIEGQLLACCLADLAARVMIVGHHGSKTSSRRALLNAVNASLFIVSSGPTKYGSVTLPDQEVIDELQSRGQVFRTDVNDSACATNTAKIGPDADGKAGGCDNIRVTLSDTTPLQVAVWNGHD